MIRHIPASIEVTCDRCGAIAIAEANARYISKATGDVVMGGKTAMRECFIRGDAEQDAKIADLCAECADQARILIQSFLTAKR